MAILVRRSNLMVAVTDADMVSQAWRHNADAITLDLEEGVAAARKEEARGLVKETIASCRQGAAEVFVRVNPSSLQADLDASRASHRGDELLRRREAGRDRDEVLHIQPQHLGQVAHRRLAAVALPVRVRGEAHGRVERRVGRDRPEVLRVQGQSKAVLGRA